MAHDVFGQTATGETACDNPPGTSPHGMLVQGIRGIEPGVMASGGCEEGPAGDPRQRSVGAPGDPPFVAGSRAALTCARGGTTRGQAQD